VRNILSTTTFYRLILSIAVLCTVPATATSLKTNQQFVNEGIGVFVDSLVTSLGIEAGNVVYVDSIEGEFGSIVRHTLARSLMVQGSESYLTPTVVNGKLLLQCYVNHCSLVYQGMGGGLFKPGGVERVFAITGYGRLLDERGLLVASTPQIMAALLDTLTFDQARSVVGPSRFLAPKLPPTLFQRLIEPGIVVGITGALVYLIFASR
jgi:hypothetical protein